MAAKASRAKLEDRLAELSSLRQEPDSEQVGRVLAAALADRSNQIVARAARLVAELGQERLVPDLVAAFDRLLAEPVKRDKTCAGKIEIAKALLELEAPEPELFARGSRHVQLEAAYGPPVDTAAELRAQCALGLAQSGHPDATLELVRLLVDPEATVRHGAIQALGARGGIEAEPLLRLKALAGDAEAEVTATCFGALLEVEPERSLDFVAGFLESEDRELSEAAALALGECRLDGALPVLLRPLREGSAIGFDPERRQPLLRAISMLRREDAFDVLVGWIREADRPRAEEALSVLAIHAHDERLEARIRAALDEREEVEGDTAPLRRLFARIWGG